MPDKFGRSFPSLLFRFGQAPHLVTGKRVGVVEGLVVEHGQAEASADGEEVAHAGFVHLVERRLMQMREQHHAGVGIGVFHEPVGLLDVTATGDNPVILHENNQ